MRWIAVAAILALGVADTPARADTDQFDFDLIHRPARTTDSQVNAGVQVATKACDPTGRLSYGSRIFMSCMRTKGYKFLRVEHKKSPPSDPYFSSSAKLAPGHFIDHDNGMDCQHMGWGEVCSTPTNGTVHYFNPDEGLPCTRTGAVEICSNL